MAGARLGLVEVALDALEKLCVEVERACRLRVERYRAKVELLRLLLVLQDLRTAHAAVCSRVLLAPTPSRLTAFMINACVRRASEAAGTGKRPGGLGGETPSPDGVESIQRRTQTPYLLDEARVRKDHRHIRRLYLQRCIVTVIATCANTMAHTRTPHLQRLLEDALCAQQVAVHTPCQLGEAVQRRHKLVVVRQSTSEEDLRR